MKRTVWKWLLGISIVVLVLLILFTLVVWALVNMGGAVMLALLSSGTANTEVQFRGMSMAELLKNFVGSPMFYLYLGDLAMLAGAITMLIVTKKRQVAQKQHPELEEDHEFGI